MTTATAAGGGVPAPAIAETAQATETAPTEGQGAAPEPEDVASLFRKHKHKLKIDGQEAEVDYDDLVRDAQKVRAAEKRFQEAAKLMKELGATKAEIEAFKKNPWEALKSAGQDPYQLAENLLLEKLQWEQMPESERRALMAEHKAKLLEDRLTAEEKRQKEASAKMAQAQAYQEIDEEIGAALKEMGRKPTPRLIARVAESLLAHHERQLTDLQRQFGEEIPDEAFQRVPRLSAADAVKRVQREYMSDIAEYLTGLSGEELRKVLPKEVLDALRKAEVQQVLSQDPLGSRKPRQQHESPSRPQKTKRMTSDEFFKLKEQKWGT